MKLSLIFLCSLMSIVLAARYDDIDLDTILSNDRVLNSYIKCMLDKGPCTPEGRDLREKAPAALESACGSCSPKQKSLVRKTSKFLIKNKPKEWALLQEKYDPEKKYRENFQKFLDSTD